VNIDTTTETAPDTVGGSPGARASAGLQPWQFFVLAGLACATAITFLARSQGVTVVVLLTVLMATTCLVGIAALWTVRPLVSTHDDRVPPVGHRTRAVLEREKLLTLRSIKELEFDKAMGKLSDADFLEMSGRLRARVGRLMRELDAGVGYRAQIERDLLKRLGEGKEKASAAREGLKCAACATLNDADARFCKACGTSLTAH